MKMKVINSMKRFSEDDIEEIVDILKNNGVISVPTDTVYGVCARIDSKKAHDNLILVKNRPETKPFPVMCANEEQIKGIAIVNEKAEKIIKSFMPGPITIVLNKKETVPDYITNGKKTIAIRMATSKTLEKIILALGAPIFMSSANQSGEKTSESLEEIEKNCPKINGILEGKIKLGVGSTIIDCTSEKIKVLREGPIKLEEINNIINHS